MRRRDAHAHTTAGNETFVAREAGRGLLAIDAAEHEASGGGDPP